VELMLRTLNEIVPECHVLSSTTPVPTEPPSVRTGRRGNTVATLSRAPLPCRPTWHRTTTNLAARKYQNLHEHSVVVDEIVRNLANVYEDIDADAEPRSWRYERSRTWGRASAHARLIH